MPPGADVVYSVISGGVTLARQVFDRLFTQEAHTHRARRSNHNF